MDLRVARPRLMQWSAHGITFVVLSLCIIALFVNEQRSRPFFVGETAAIAFGLWGVSVLAWHLRRQTHAADRFFFLAAQFSASILATVHLWDLPGFHILYFVLVGWNGTLILQFYLTATLPTNRPLEQWIIRVSYGIAILFTLRVLTAPWGDVTLHVLIYGWLILAFVLSLVWVMRRAMHSTLQRSARFLIYGALLAWGPLFFLTILPYLLLVAAHPAIDQPNTRVSLQFTGDVGFPQVPFEVTLPFLLLFPLTYAYQVLLSPSAHLQRWEQVITRTSEYYLLTVALLATYLYSTVLVTRLPWHATLWTNGIASVTSLLVVIPLSKIVHRWMYWIWMDDPADLMATIERITQRLAMTLDRTTLGILLTQEILRAVQLDGSALWLGSRPDDLTLVASQQVIVPVVTIPHDGALARYWATHPALGTQQTLRAALRTASLLSAEQTVLSLSQCQYWMPLLSGGDLHGVVAFASDDPLRLSPIQQQTVITLCNQAAITAHNVRLIEEQTRIHHQLISAQERWRRTLARELHDDTVQQLLATSLDVARLPCTNPEQASIAHQIRQDIVGMVQQLRRLISDLRPAGLEELGVVGALEGYLERMQRETGGVPDLELHVEAYLLDPPEDIGLCLVRVGQEAIRNAIQHAQAQQILLRLSVIPHEATLTVEDDGHGFVVPPRLGELARHDHFGLIGLAERVAWSGGRFEIQSHPGQGTIVRVLIPLPGGQ
jgi:signal transduction histidine kinase